MNIEFMRFRKMASALSIILLIISIGSLAIKNLELGLDFTGGILLEIKLDQDIENLEEVRNLLAEEGIENFVLNFSGSQNDLSIKIPGGEDSSNNESLKKILKDNFSYNLRKEEFIGPQVGEELRDQGGLGLLIALLIMTIYIMFRFQYKFAVGAILALAHDVLIVLGFFSLLSIDFDLTVLAALLAVIGYSLNDTIVVSDRIRENFRKKRRAEATQLIDRSLNQMLGRTLITSLTTLLVLFALFIFGGDAIQNFSLALIIGVLAGTYSSIYIVCNVLISMNIIADDLAVRKAESYDDGMP
jgi:preprotein translocase subunit SecF